MDSDQLPNSPPDRGNGDRSYYRRRIDELVDRRLQRIEDAIRSLDARTDILDHRLAWFAGALAVLIFLAQLIGPAIVHLITGS